MMSSQFSSSDSFARATVAKIKLSNLEHNLQWVKSLLSPGEFLCPMIKADAYGHGDFRIAKHLQQLGVERFGVALIEEGISLRKKGLASELLVFADYTDSVSCESVLEFGLTPVVSSWGQLEGLRGALSKFKSNRLSVHIEFDTGMNRLGFSVEESVQLQNWLKLNSQIHVAGVMTHFHSSDDLIRSGKVQLERFQNALSGGWDSSRVIVHTMNSAALMRRSQQRKEYESLPLVGARPGLSLYGLTPISDSPSLSGNLRPVMQLTSRILQIREVRAGETVSYGATWKAKVDSVIGVVPVGYGDGYPRHLSNKGQVLCRGERISVVGIVCMDYLMIDLTRLAQRSGKENLCGESVELLGAEIKTEELAELAQTIPYELVTRISSRVPRIYE